MDCLKKYTQKEINNTVNFNSKISYKFSTKNDMNTAIEYAWRIRMTTFKEIKNQFIDDDGRIIEKYIKYQVSPEKLLAFLNKEIEKCLNAILENKNDESN